MLRQDAKEAAVITRKGCKAEDAETLLISTSSALCYFPPVPPRVPLHIFVAVIFSSHAPPPDYRLHYPATYGVGSLPLCATLAHKSKLGVEMPPLTSIFRLQWPPSNTKLSS